MAKFGDTNTQDTMSGLPAGGTAGQALTKTTGADFDAGWAAVGGTGGPGGFVTWYINTSGALGPFAGSSTATGIQIDNVSVTAGRYYLVNVLLTMVPTALMTCSFHFNDGTNSMQIASGTGQSTIVAPVVGSLLYSPSSSGVKTLRVDMTRVSGTGNMNIQANSTQPIQLMLTDIGGTAPSTVRGLIASNVLTTSQTGNLNSLQDALTLSYTPVAGASYRYCVLSPFTKSVATSYSYVRINVAGTDLYCASIPAVASGELYGSVLHTPPTPGVATTLLVIHEYQGGGTNNLTLPGSATAPRQLWVERVV